MSSNGVNHALVRAREESIPHGYGNKSATGGAAGDEGDGKSNEENVRSDEADVVGEAGSGVARDGGKRDYDVVHDQENGEAEDDAEENRLA